MRTEDKFLKLASHKGEDVTSDSIQKLVELYSNDYLKTVTDAKYGTGSCDFIVESFRYYLYKDEKK